MLTLVSTSTRELENSIPLSTKDTGFLHSFFASENFLKNRNRLDYYSLLKNSRKQNSKLKKTSILSGERYIELYNILYPEANKKWLPTNEEYSNFYSPLNAIERARNRCNMNSDLYHALDDLNHKALSLPYKSFEALSSQVNILLDDLSNTAIDDKTQSINTFSKNCNQLLNGEYYQVKNALSLIAMTVLIGAITALIGFGIGFALGTWTGPGAFF